MICPRCNKVHTCPPMRPERVLSEKSKEIAKYIDHQVLKQLKESNMSDEYKVIESHHTPDPIEKWLVIGKVVLVIVGILVLAYFFRA